MTRYDGAYLHGWHDQLLCAELVCRHGVLLAAWCDQCAETDPCA